MISEIDHDIFNDALGRAGSNWNAAQTHGLLASRLAVSGAAGAPAWLAYVLEDTDSGNAHRKECEDMLTGLFQVTHQALSERLSAFTPLLPDDEQDADVRTEALAHWCEGYLHGLVSAEHSDALRQQISAEPVADIVKDMLKITQAAIDDDASNDDNEEAYFEIVEYLRVAAQLVYEELAAHRPESAV